MAVLRRERRLVPTSINFINLPVATVDVHGRKPVASSRNLLQSFIISTRDESTFVQTFQLIVIDADQYEQIYV